MGKDDGGDIGVIDELVNDANAGVVEDDDRVVALACHIQYETVCVIIPYRRTIRALCSPRVAEDQAGFRRRVDTWVSRGEVPEHLRTVVPSLLRDGVKRRADQ